MTYRPTEALRVVRSRTHFGTLNLPTPKAPVSAPQIRKAGAECLQLLSKEGQTAAAGEDAVAMEEVREAKTRVRAAMRALEGAAGQREEIRERARPMRPEHVLDCDIDVRALEEYLKQHGDENVGGGRSTKRRAAEAAMKQATKVTDGIARLRLEYRYSDTGRALWEAGHVTGSREMSSGSHDPFKWSKDMRGAALGSLGAEMDDKSCYPTAWRAMRGTGGPMTTAYLEHKEEILKVFGGHLWPDASEAERRERMKGAMSALDNNGGLDAWRKKNPSAKSLRGVKHALPNGVTFTCHAYKEEQTAGTAQAMAESQRALQYLDRLWTHKTKRENTERKRQNTWKSYVLQEAEAASREAKLSWCWQNDVRVVSLQHDGVQVEAAGEAEMERIARGIAKAASAACGYAVKIDAKRGTAWVA